MSSSPLGPRGEKWDRGSPSLDLRPSASCRHNSPVPSLHIWRETGPPPPPLPPLPNLCLTHRKQNSVSASLFRRHCEKWWVDSSTHFDGLLWAIGFGARQGAPEDWALPSSGDASGNSTRPPALGPSRHHRSGHCTSQRCALQDVAAPIKQCKALRRAPGLGCPLGCPLSSML